MLETVYKLVDLLSKNERGKIASQGTFNELCENSYLFKRMINSNYLYKKNN